MRKATRPITTMPPAIPPTRGPSMDIVVAVAEDAAVVVESATAEVVVLGVWSM